LENQPENYSLPTLLAVDLGLRAGLALYDGDGRLRWYRSHNFGNNSRLRRGIYTILNEIDNLHYIVLEGSGHYATIWRREAARRKLNVIQISAEEWRPDLLLPRQQRSGSAAKQHADQLARRVISWSAAPTPTALDHNAAEAILVGLWALLHIGWLPDNPFSD